MIFKEHEEKLICNSKKRDITIFSVLIMLNYFDYYML